MFENFRADIHRFARTDRRLSPVDCVRQVLTNFGLQALAAYRLGQWIRSTHHRPMFWLLALALLPFYVALSKWVRLAYDIHLDQSARIGPGLYIGHFGGIRVLRCTIGACCSIQQHTRLEPSDPDQSGGGPIVGHNVWIGAHAQVLGKVHIGDRATVAAGALVEDDVPAGSLALGNPARVIRLGFDNSTFL